MDERCLKLAPYLRENFKIETLRIYKVSIKNGSIGVIECILKYGNNINTFKVKFKNFRVREFVKINVAFFNFLLLCFLLCYLYFSILVFC